MVRSFLPVVIFRVVHIDRVFVYIMWIAAVGLRISTGFEHINYFT